MTTDQQIEQIYQRDSRRVLATLIRLLGDFEMAEEAMHEAFTAALQQWPQQGVPANASAWLITTGHHKGIDQIRRLQTARRHLQQVLPQGDQADSEAAQPGEEVADHAVADDQLRLIFTCCHPSLSPEAQLALTLREMCGLTTEQVASALLQQPSTVAQRIVRAKRKIRDSRIPYEVPEAKALPQRLQSVLQVVYLMFNEGYSSSQGADVTNVDLAGEAVRLGGHLSELLPHGDVSGLLALMLLQDSRRAARQNAQGDLLTLEEQDRRLWNQDQIRDGMAWLARALAQAPAGSYTLQAAIAALHAEADSPASTDWPQIAGLYDVLLRVRPTPVVALNRAVAISMRDGPTAGLQLMDELAAAGRLDGYHLLHAARADCLRRLGQAEAARLAYEQALALTRQLPEQRFLQRRLAALS